MTEKKGCQVLLIVLGALLAVGMIFTGGLNFGQDRNPTVGANRIVFIVEGTNVTATEAETAASEFARTAAMQMGFPLDRSLPQADFQAVAGGVGSIVGRVALRQLAQANNVSINDSELRESIQEQVEAEIAQYKLQLQLAEGIAPDKVEEEFTKRNNGRSAQQTVADTMVDVDDAIKDPAQRQQLEIAVLAQAIQKSYADKVAYTEEDLRKTYDTYIFEEIAFDTSTKTPEEKETAADQARRELQEGADPKAVREKYTEGSTRTTLELTPDSMQINPGYVSLAELKPGEVSEVLDPLGFPAVFKLTKIENKLPEDFETQKESLLASRKQQEAQAEFQKALEERRDSLKIDWKDKGYQMIWETGKLYSDMSMFSDPDKFKASLNSLYSDITKAKSDETADYRYINLSAFIVSEQLLAVADETENEEATKRWLEDALAVTDYYDSTGFRLTLYDRLVQTGQTEDAYIQLLEAARINRNFDQQGQSWYTTISNIVEEAKSAETYTPEQVKTIEDELSSWLAAKIRDDQEQAEIAEAERRFQEELDRDNIDEPAEGEGSTADPQNENTANEGN